MKDYRVNQLYPLVRNISDYPVVGIQFKDLTPLFKDQESLLILTNILLDEYENKGITKVVGIESRGFIMGSIIAQRLGVGFVPIRKSGKLPHETIQESYNKEYGLDKIEIHKDALEESDIVLLHDDLFATGGTMIAAYNLISKLNVKDIYTNAIIELESLRGRQSLPRKMKFKSLLKFEI